MAEFLAAKPYIPAASDRLEAVGHDRLALLQRGLDPSGHRPARQGFLPSLPVEFEAEAQTDHGGRHDQSPVEANHLPATRQAGKEHPEQQRRAPVHGDEVVLPASSLNPRLSEAGCDHSKAGDRGLTLESEMIPGPLEGQHGR